MKFGKLVLTFAVASVFGMSVVGMTAERDPLAPRVPADEMEEAREWKNPFKATPENIAKGKALFTGKATCFTCHGNEGRGDGVAGAALDPSPRNFHNPGLKKKHDGEFNYVIHNGIEGTGMISYAPGIVTDEEAALIILFERSLHDVK
ncbi:MAG: c-type cytochrome [Nitrospiria bacterium]